MLSNPLLEVLQFTDGQLENQSGMLDFKIKDLTPLPYYLDFKIKDLTPLLTGLQNQRPDPSTDPSTSTQKKSRATKTGLFNQGSRRRSYCAR